MDDATENISETIFQHRIKVIFPHGEPDETQQRVCCEQAILKHRAPGKRITVSELSHWLGSQQKGGVTLATQRNEFKQLSPAYPTASLPLFRIQSAKLYAIAREPAVLLLFPSAPVTESLARTPR